MNKETWILTNEELNNQIWTMKANDIEGHSDILLKFIQEYNLSILNNNKMIYEYSSELARKGNFIFNFEDNMVVCFIPEMITSFQYDFLTKGDIKTLLAKLDLHAFSYSKNEGELFTKLIEKDLFNEGPSVITKFYKEIKNKYNKNKEKIKR